MEFTIDELVEFIYCLGVSYKEKEQLQNACEKFNLNFEEIQDKLARTQIRDEKADNYDTWNDHEIRMF